MARLGFAWGGRLPIRLKGEGPSPLNLDMTLLPRMPDKASPHDLIDVIRSRRSVRSFRSDSIPDEHLKVILDAARLAPTVGNEQPWHFLVVRDRLSVRNLRGKLERSVRARVDETYADPEDRPTHLTNVLTRFDEIFAAPVFVFIFVETSRYPELVRYDGALAAENLMLAAKALGYGSCFMTSFFPERVVREHFAVPEDLKLVCVVPVGLPTEWPPEPTKKPIEELVHYENM